jgi:FixJ family two-component response regulator
VLLDLLLPAGESGVEVLEHLRARRWCVPVIVISGAVASERDALLKSHALPVHRKPLRIEGLVQTIVALSPQRFAPSVEHAIEQIPLTRRLAEMFRRMARGSHGRTLACEMRITDVTLQSMRAEFRRRCDVSPEELLMEMRAAYPWPLPDFVGQTRGDARSYG